MNNKKMVQPILWGVLMIVIIIGSIYFSKHYKSPQDEEPKSYECEIIDDSKENPKIKGVQ